MYKKIAEFLSAQGMTVTKNTAYGIVRGYETNVAYNAIGTFPVVFHISFHATDGQRGAIASVLQGARLKFFTMQFTPFGISFGINDLTGNRLVKRLPSILDLVYGALTSNEVSGAEYCPVCGNKLSEDSKSYEIGGATIRIDGECVNQINTVITEENKQFDAAPDNYLLGFFGALIGAVVGGLCSAALYAVGFVSALSAVIAVLLGAFLYQKFGGKPNKGMIVIVSLTTLVVMEISTFVIYLVASGIAANQAGLAMSALDAFLYCMRDAEFSRAFYLDLVLTFVFSALGVGLEIYYLAQKIKRAKAIGGDAQQK